MITAARASRVVLPLLLAAAAATSVSACTSVPEGPKPTLSGQNTMLTMTPGFYGDVLTDGTGRVLYQFSQDKPGGTVTCTGSCEQTWQPYIATGEPTPVDTRLTSLDVAKVSTVSRADGRSQVSYAGHPLYFFTGDKKPGDVSGAGQTQFGGQWFPVTSAGGPVVP